MICGKDIASAEAPASAKVPACAKTILPTTGLKYPAGEESIRIQENRQ
jgi:hypothetical protein